jgi:hypothetical protein
MGACILRLPAILKNKPPNKGDARHLLALSRMEMVLSTSTVVTVPQVTRLAHGLVQEWEWAPTYPTPTGKPTVIGQREGCRVDTLKVMKSISSANGNTNARGRRWRSVNTKRGSGSTGWRLTMNMSVSI